MEIDVMSWFSKWLEGIPSELLFWENYFFNHGGLFVRSFNASTDKNRHFPIVLEDEIPDACTGRVYRFIDVGSGPVSRCGCLTNKVDLHFEAVDPLAFAYNSFRKKYKVDNGISILTGFVELLSHDFPENAFDMVHMSNSLDHSFDPVLGIYQLLYICKVGGKVILRHSENEAEQEKYEGFHQWNLCIDHDKFVIWRPGIRYDMSKMLGENVDIRCYRHVDDPEEITWKYDKVVLLKKKSVDIPKNNFYEKILKSVYENMLKVILQYQVEPIDFWKTETGKMYQRLEELSHKPTAFEPIRDKLSSCNVAIYGIGFLGQRLVELLKQYQIKILALIDARRFSFLGMETICLEQYSASRDSIIIIASIVHARELSENIYRYRGEGKVMTISELI